MNLFILFPFIINIPITIATERMTKEKRIYPTGILGFTHSYIVSIKKTAAGSGFAPQAIAYSIIPAEPFEVINLNNVSSTKYKCLKIW